MKPEPNTDQASEWQKIAYNEENATSQKSNWWAYVKDWLQNNHPLPSKTDIYIAEITREQCLQITTIIWRNHTVPVIMRIPHKP